MDLGLKNSKDDSCIQGHYQTYLIFTLAFSEEYAMDRV